MVTDKKEIYIGTSGWSYEHWKEMFYPEGLKPAGWLHYYSDFFSTVEINTTFYHTPKQKTVENWYSAVPENFFFSIKINRYISHLKRLKDCNKILKIFYSLLKLLMQPLSMSKKNKEFDL